MIILQFRTVVIGTHFFLLRVEFWKTLAQKKGEVLHVSTAVRRFDGVCNQPNQT